MFLRYLAERVTSGLDLRGQSQEITPSGYLNIQRNSENLTLYQFDLLSSGVVFITCLFVSFDVF